MICVSSAPSLSSRFGPMIDGGAPYNAIGNTKLHFHHERLTGPNLTLEPLPSELSGCQYW